MKTTLIAGLGNPGKKFEKTRHNAGFAFLEYFWKERREEFCFSDWKSMKKLKSEISVGKHGGKKIVLLKPVTFMNLSGEAVSAAKKYFEVELENIFAIHDEIDLPLGNSRFSTASSSAGHKGAQDIIDFLGTKNFTRLRIGVDDRKEKTIATEKYVLGKFTKSQQNILENTFHSLSVELLERIS